MAISQQQKVDFLLKKIGYTKTKTGLAVDSSLSGTKKAGFAEALPSPLIIADTSLWTESGLIPTTPPGSDSSQVKVYLAGSSGLRLTVDSTVAGNRSFLAYTTYNNTSSARLTNWIDTQFGNDYLIKVYKGDPNSGGVALSASGSGANDGWFFDYSAGVLNFNDTNVPSGVTGTNIYIVGYRYIGNTGAPTPGDNFRFTDLVVDRNLKVGGISTFNGIVDINSDLDVDGHTNLDNLSIAGVSTFTGAITANGPIDLNADLDVDGHTNLDNVNISGIATVIDLDVDGHTNLDNLSIAGVTTAAGAIDLNADLDVDGHTNLDNVSISGFTTITQDLDVDGHTNLDNVSITGFTTISQDLDVDGHTNLDNVSIAGVTTAAGAIDLNADLDVDGHTNLDNVSIAGVTTTAGLLDINAGGQANTFKVEDLTDNRVVIAGTGGELEDSANLTFNGTTLGLTGSQTISGDIDVDGHTNLDNVSIAGVTTATGKIDANSDVDVAGTLDVDGHTELDNVNISGVVTATSAKVSDLTNDRVVIVGTGGELEDSNNLTFNGSNLTVGGNVNAVDGVFTGNVTVGGTLTYEDVTNVDAVGFVTARDGLIVVSGGASITAGGLNVTAGVSTFNGALDINNNVVIDGNVDLNGDIDVDGHTNLDNVSIAGVTTAAGLLDINAGGQANTFKVEDLTDNRVVIAGTGGELEDSGNLTFDGTTLGLTGSQTISNQLTVTGAIDANGDLDVDGHTDLDNVNISGIATVIDLDVDGHTNLDNVSISGVTTAAGAIDLNADLDVDGHTNLDNVSIAGFTTISQDLDVDGHTNLDNVSIAGFTTISQDLDVDGHTNLDNLSVSGVSTFTGAITANGSIDLNADIDVDGHTNLDNVSIAGVTTTAGAVDINADLDVDGHTNLDNVNIAGVTTAAGKIDANADVDVAGTLDVDGHTELDNANVSGVATITTLNVGTAGQSGLVGITTILDEDNMASNSAAALATQQSIKAYVDTQVTAQDLDFQGDSGTGSIDLDSQSLDIEGTSNEIETLASGQKIKIGLPNNVTISNQLTVSGAIDANGDVDVDGHTNLDNLSVAGVSTFTGAITANGSIDLNADIDVDGHTNLDNVSIAGVTTTSGLLDINSGGQANTFKVEDLTPTRVVFAGAGGELQDSNNLIFDGSQLYVSGIAITTAGAGHTSVIGVDITTRNLKATGITTLQGIVDIESNLDVDGHAEFDDIRVAGIATFSGPITAGSSLGVNGQYMKRTATGVIWDSFPTLRNTQTFTATASQDTFNFSYNVGFLDVYHNGVKLTSSEFTASNGTNVVLGVGCFLGDIVELVSYNTVTTGGGGGGGSGSVVGINTLATSYFNHINAVGVITASKLYGDGSNLTGVIASGTGIVIKDSGSAVGTAGTINFGANLDVTAVSAGIVTVNSSGVIAGINTIGFSTFKDLLISGVSTFNGAANFNGNTVITNLNAGGNSYPTVSGTNGQVLTSNGSGTLTWTNKGSGSAGVGGTWVTDTIGINTTKNVGIGTTAKSGYALYVQGNQRVTGILTVGTASLTLDGVSNKVTVGTAVTLFGETGLFVGGDSNLHSTGLEIKNINASGNLDVDGLASFDDIAVSAASTFSGAVDINSDIDVDGHAEFDNVRVSGVTTTAAVNWGGHMLPTNNAVFDIGSADKKVRHLFLSSNSLKFVDSADAEHPLSVDSGRLKFAGGLLLGSAIKADAASGVVTATSFVGNGSGLTGVVASGTGLVIKNSDSTVGTAGTINFGSGLNVSPASAGIVTITAINSDWDATSGISSILNKPTLITYDLVGSNNTTNQAIISLTPNSGTADTIELLGANGTTLTWDASNKRVTFDSVAPVNADWNATSGISSIKNKPTIPSAYTLPTASGSTLGGIKVGANLSINGSGVLSANAGGYTLPMAAAGTLGGIKIGSGLSIDGNGVVTASGSASTPSIADVNSTTGSIADDAAANLNITGHKAYTLFKVTVSKPSWVRIYCDAASRTADVNRSESNDPTPGSGVIAEVRTTSDNQAVLITPGIQGFNNDSPDRTSNIYTSVTNRSGSATAVTVTLTVLQTGS